MAEKPAPGNDEGPDRSGPLGVLISHFAYATICAAWLNIDMANGANSAAAAIRLYIFIIFNSPFGSARPDEKKIDVPLAGRM